MNTLESMEDPGPSTFIKPTEIVHTDGNWWKLEGPFEEASAVIDKVWTWTSCRL